MRFSVEITRRAEKDLDGLDRTIEKQVRDRFKQLVQDPFSPHLSQQVKMGEGERKSRVRNWRIFLGFGLSGFLEMPRGWLDMQAEV